MYENYVSDRESVHETWRKYFDDIEDGRGYDEGAFNRPTVVIGNKSKKEVAGLEDAKASHLAVSLSMYHSFVWIISCVFGCLSLVG